MFAVIVRRSWSEDEVYLFDTLPEAQAKAQAEEHDATYDVKSVVLLNVLEIWQNPNYVSPSGGYGGSRGGY